MGNQLIKTYITMEEFLKNLPKAELHVHLEGTFEADLWQKIA